MKTLNVIWVALAFAFSATAADGLTEKLQRGLFEEEANHNLDAAIKEYQSVVAQSDEQRKVIATALFRLGECYRKLGKTNDANAQYQRILRDFAEQDQLVKLSRDLLPRASVSSTPYVATTTDPAAVNLLREEIRVAEQVVLMVEKKLNAGKTTLYEILEAKKDVLRLKRQLPENWPPAQQRVLLEEQIGIVKQLLTDQERRIEVGVLPRGDQLPVQRELLSLQRELAVVGDVAKGFGDAPSLAPAMTQAEAEELARIKTVAQNSPDLLERGGALAGAVQLGYVNVVRFLLEQGISPDGSSPNSGSPIFLAAQKGHRAVVELLLQKKAKPDLFSNSSTPLMAAARSGYLSVVETLIKGGADVNVATEKGITALHQAVAGGHQQIVQLLIKNGANVNALGGSCNGCPSWWNDGVTPLHIAASDNPSLVEPLLQAGANAKLTNSLGKQALHYAAAFGRDSVVEPLLERGSDPNLLANNDWSPFLEAVANNQSNTVALLLKHGADVNARVGEYDAPTSPPGMRPVARPARGGRSSGNDSRAGQPAIALAPSLGVLQHLIKAGADVNATNRSGRPAIANMLSNPAMALALLEAGANPNVELPDGERPLHWAMRWLQMDTVAALLNHGANPNVVTANGETPLSIAQNYVTGRLSIGSNDWEQSRARENAGKIVELLRAAGADAFLQRRGSISAVRGPQQRVNLFSRGTNDLNGYFLFELLAAVYQDGGASFPFPDFTRLRVHRLDGQKEILIDLDVEAALNSTNCAKDMPLQWGDEVEIPMSVHQLDSVWNSLPPDQVMTLNRCVERTVRVFVSGTNIIVKLGPSVRDNRWKYNATPSFSFASLSAMVQSKAEVKKLLRTSSDLQRVIVKRSAPNPNEPGSRTFDATKVYVPNVGYSDGVARISWQHDLWLRDGDVIEVPEKR